MLQYVRRTVEFEVCFVKPSVNTLSFTGQFKYHFSIFNCLFIFIYVYTRLANVTDLNFKVGFRSHCVSCTRSREESS